MSSKRKSTIISQSSCGSFGYPDMPNAGTPRLRQSNRLAADSDFADSVTASEKSLEIFQLRDDFQWSIVGLTSCYIDCQTIRRYNICYIRTLGYRTRSQRLGWTRRTDSRQAAQVLGASSQRGFSVGPRTVLGTTQQKTLRAIGVVLNATTHAHGQILSS